jgi:hypothetical protein
MGNALFIMKTYTNTKWRKMKDAPKNGTLILGYEEDGWICVFYWEDSLDRWCTQEGAYGQELLYWMPLPEAP